MAPLWFEEWRALWILIVRAMLYCQKHGQNEIRVPQNIAGSAVNPDEGGRPSESEGE